MLRVLNVSDLMSNEHDNFSMSSAEKPQKKLPFHHFSEHFHAGTSKPSGIMVCLTGFLNYYDI